jgi:hypothetical protein
MSQFSRSHAAIAPGTMLALTDPRWIVMASLAMVQLNNVVREGAGQLAPPVGDAGVTGAFTGLLSELVQGPRRSASAVPAEESSSIPQRTAMDLRLLADAGGKITATTPGELSTAGPSSPFSSTALSDAKVSVGTTVPFAAGKPLSADATIRRDGTPDARIPSEARHPVAGVSLLAQMGW